MVFTEFDCSTRPVESRGFLGSNANALLGRLSWRGTVVQGRQSWGLGVATPRVWAGGAVDGS